MVSYVAQTIESISMESDDSFKLHGVYVLQEYYFTQNIGYMVKVTYHIDYRL
mgnify:CR=1 FL=1